MNKAILRLERAENGDYVPDKGAREILKGYTQEQIARNAKRIGDIYGIECLVLGTAPDGSMIMGVPV